MTSFANWLREATVRLESAGIRQSARFEAECMLCEASSFSRTELLTQLTCRLEDVPRSRADGFLDRRCHGEPLQYILGWWEFYGRRFQVTRDVLIPRPETELLVNRALSWLRSHGERSRVLDVGTGSGCIACTIALEASESSVVAVDISERALDVARGNARDLGAHQVMFVQSDLLEGLGHSIYPVSLCLANLPYVAQNARWSLPAEVREYEPELALFAGEDGLDLYRRLLLQLPAITKPGEPFGLIFECGEDHAQTLAQLVGASMAFDEVHVWKDFTHRDRFVYASVERGSIPRKEEF